MANKRITLTSEEYEYLSSRLQITFNRKKDADTGELIINSTPSNYVNLASLIKKETGKVLIKQEWLREFLYYHKKNPRKQYQTHNLDICCSFIHEAEITVYDFLKYRPDSGISLIGKYKIYWSGATIISHTPTYSEERELIITPKESILKSSKYGEYKGSPPLKLGGKVYFEVSNYHRVEKVYFILHVGNASGDELRYIPGIFASGDTGNVSPCAGPIIVVRDEETSLDKELMGSYFQDFAGNNLIKTWTIAKILETRNGVSKKHIEKKNTKDTLPRLDDKISLYFNQKFFFYFWSYREEIGSEMLGRGILLIGEDTDTVEVTGLEGTTYTGKIKMLTDEHIGFELHTDETSEKSLSIKLKIGPNRLFPYALGIYTIIGTHRSIVAGTFLMQKYDYENEIPFTPSYIEMNQIKKENDYIWRYFNSKEKNHIKTPADGIFEDEDFIKFFREQELKKYNPVTNSPISNIFIAAPMSANQEIFDNTREKIMKLQKNLNKKFNVDVYYAGTAYNSDIGFTYAYKAAELDFKKLDESDRFILIHPAKVASSTLIELGWALSQRKSCVIFYKNIDDLPFLVRGVRNSKVKKIKYKSMDNLLAMVEHFEENLFP